MLQRQHRLQHPREAGACLEVPDVGLDAAHRNAPVRRAGGAEELPQALQLHLVPDGRPRAVPLDQADGGRVDSGAGVGALVGQHLPLDGGRVDPRRAPVGRRGAGLDDGVDPVAVALRRGARLEHHHDGALADQHAARVSVVGRQLGLGREDGRLGERHTHQQRVVGAGRADHHAFAVAVLDLVHRHAQRRHGPSAGRVDRKVHAVQIKDVGDAPCRDVRQDAREGVEAPLGVLLLERLGALRHRRLGQPGLPQDGLHHGERHPLHQGRGVLVRAARRQHHAHLALLAAYRVRVPRVLQRVLDFQQRQRLVAVHVLELHHVEPKLARRKGEVWYVAAVLAVRLVDLLRVRVVERRHVQAVGRRLGEGVDAREQRVPCCLRARAVGQVRGVANDHYVRRHRMDRSI